MKIQQIEKPAFQLAGLAMESKMGSDFSGLWNQLFDILEEHPPQDMTEGPSLGACYDMKDDGTFRYMAGYLHEPGAEVPAGLELADIPAATYAVIPLKGPVPVCIQDGWKYVMEEYLPQHGLRHAGTPDFEAYYPGDISKEAYQMELWVPVTPIEKERV